MWYLYNVVVKCVLVGKNLEAGATKVATWDQGEFDYHALLHPLVVLDILLSTPLPLHLLSTPLPLHLLLIILILPLLLPILLLLPLFQEVWKAFRPSLLSCRDL